MRILMVCLGNICRSPIAEAMLRSRSERDGLNWTVDSAGTGDWHIGKPPDPRAVAAAARVGLDISGLRARQVDVADFRHFDRIVALDASNLNALAAMMPEDGGAALGLLMDFVPGREGSDVADPYFGDDAGFDRCVKDIAQGVEGLVAALSKRAA